MKDIITCIVQFKDFFIIYIDFYGVQLDVVILVMVVQDKLQVIESHFDRGFIAIKVIDWLGVYEQGVK
jgi:hypothetical protein